MADTVDTLTLISQYPLHVVRLTNESDGTGESGVAKVDKSALTMPNGTEPKAVDVQFIEYNVQGFNYVTLHWDHSTNDEIAVLFGAGIVDAAPYGGLRDPVSAGGTGDILLTTDGAADGDSYNIILHCRLRGS